MLLAMAPGLCVKEAAEMLGIGENTAKTHLQHIHSKTGSKQTELIRLFMSSTPPVNAGQQPAGLGKIPAMSPFNSWALFAPGILGKTANSRLRRYHAHFCSLAERRSGPQPNWLAERGPREPPCGGNGVGGTPLSHGPHTKFPGGQGLARCVLKRTKQLRLL